MSPLYFFGLSIDHFGICTGYVVKSYMFLCTGTIWLHVAKSYIPQRYTNPHRFRKPSSPNRQAIETTPAPANIPSNPEHLTGHIIGQHKTRDIIAGNVQPFPFLAWRAHKFGLRFGRVHDDSYKYGNSYDYLYY